MESDGFEVKVRSTPGFGAEPLLVMKDFSSETEDLVLKIKRWKEGLELKGLRVNMELKGLRVNMGKTKVMYCKVGSGHVANSAKWQCGVCQKIVRANSMVCTVRKQWVHRRWSGLSGSLSVVVGFKCSLCVEGTGWEETMKEMELEHV